MTFTEKQFISYIHQSVKYANHSLTIDHRTDEIEYCDTIVSQYPQWAEQAEKLQSWQRSFTERFLTDLKNHLDEYNGIDERTALAKQCQSLKDVLNLMDRFKTDIDNGDANGDESNWLIYFFNFISFYEFKIVPDEDERKREEERLNSSVDRAYAVERRRILEEMKSNITGLKKSEGGEALISLMAQLGVFNAEEVSELYSVMID